MYPRLGMSRVLRAVWFWADALQKCLVFKNFDLCERCLRTKNDAQMNNQNETMSHSQNHSHPFKLCVSDKKWKCEGDGVGSL